MVQPLNLYYNYMHAYSIVYFYPPLIYYLCNISLLHTKTNKLLTTNKTAAKGIATL